MCERLGMLKTRTMPLHPQSDKLVEQSNCLALSLNHHDWDMHLNFVLLAYRSAVYDSTTGTPALRMLGRKLQTPAEMAIKRTPDVPVVPPEQEYIRRL